MDQLTNKERREFLKKSLATGVALGGSLLLGTHGELHAKAAGALVAPGDDEKYYQKVTIPGAKALFSTEVHELVLEADVFINVPILKNHHYTYQTIAMQNLMGVVWDRIKYHSLDLEQSIFQLMTNPD
jgi:hypothetical protein